MNRVSFHHILVDGKSICQLGDSDPWSRFFTCYYQWEPTARQAALRIRNMPCNKGRRVEVRPGRCPCEK